MLLALLLSLAASSSLSWAASGSGGSVRERERASVTPGVAIFARVHTPQGVVVIGLRRARFLGKVSLCLNESEGPDFRFVTPETCASYPVGPTSGQGIDHTHLLLGAVFSGVCSRKQFTIYTAVVLRHGLMAWLQSTDLREVPMHAVTVPKAFDVSGPLVYYANVGVWHAYDILLRDAAGKAVSRVSVLRLGAGFCTS